jgi:hypothetical protein
MHVGATYPRQRLCFFSAENNLIRKRYVLNSVLVTTVTKAKGVLLLGARLLLFHRVFISRMRYVRAKRMSFLGDFFALAVVIGFLSDTACRRVSAVGIALVAAARVLGNLPGRSFVLLRRSDCGSCKRKGALGHITYSLIPSLPSKCTACGVKRQFFL